MNMEIQYHRNRTYVSKLWEFNIIRNQSISLRFTDNIVLISNSYTPSKVVRLTVNINKTKLMINTHQQKIQNRWADIGIG